MSGAIGSLSSTTAIPGAALAGQLPVSLISPGATDPALSDKFKYPTFLRTVPSYAVFAQVGWLLDITSYINTVCLPPVEKKTSKKFQLRCTNGQSPSAVECSQGDMGMSMDIFHVSR